MAQKRVERNIVQNETGTFSVTRMIRGKTNRFGPVATLEEARTIRNETEKLWITRSKVVKSVDEVLARVRYLKESELPKP